MPNTKKKKLKILLAIALKYQRGEDSVPVVSAKGTGMMAERILELAKNAGVPLHQDEDLAQILKDVEIDSPIPPELYESVARILSFVYSADKQLKSTMD